MLVVANHLAVADGYEEKFVKLFEERAEQLRDQSGLKRVEILRPFDGDQYVIQAYWVSRDAFEQWRNSEEFEAAHADLPAEMFTGSNQLEIYEVTKEIEMKG